MRTVALTWRSERQERNALTIATEAGKMYDQLVAYVESLSTLGQRLTGSGCHDSARKRLVDGRGNLSAALKICVNWVLAPVNAWINSCVMRQMIRTSITLKRMAKPTCTGAVCTNRAPSWPYRCKALKMSEAMVAGGWNFEHGYAGLPEDFWVAYPPDPVVEPELKVLNEVLARELGLDLDWLKSPAGLQVLCGNQVPVTAEPLAMAYCGHQFGHFTMLGDGRAVLLGEQRSPQGELWDIQFKGSGRTPFSRGGDGRAVLGPMLREYLISEALNALGIPTTRTLAVVTTGEEIMRQQPGPGALIIRVASSHLRVGTFQYAIVAAAGGQ